MDLREITHNWVRLIWPKRCTFGHAFFRAADDFSGKFFCAAFAVSKTGFGGLNSLFKLAVKTARAVAGNRRING